jgi:hypothetical protein
MSQNQPCAMKNTPNAQSHPRIVITSQQALILPTRILPQSSR